MTKRWTTHGGSRTLLYRVWQGLHQRCENPTAQEFEHYGGRGIIVCPDWFEFAPFRDWALTHGYAEGLSIDRVDVNGDYEPANCEWVPLWENTRRQKGCKLDADDVRAIRLALAAGETQRSIARRYGVDQTQVSHIHRRRSWAHLD